MCFSIRAFSVLNHQLYHLHTTLPILVIHTGNYGNVTCSRRGRGVNGGLNGIAMSFFVKKLWGFFVCFFYFILDLIPLFWIWYPCFGGKDEQVLIIFLEIVLDPPLTLETFTALTTCRCKNEHDESDFLYLGRKRWLRGTVLRRMKPVPKVSIHVLQLFSVYPISFLSALIVIKIQLSVFC